MKSLITKALHQAQEVDMDYVAILVLGFFIGMMFRTNIVITKKEPGD